MADLAEVIRDIDNDMVNAHDSIAAAIHSIDECGKRIEDVTKRRDELAQLAPEIRSQQAAHLIWTRISELSNTLRELNSELEDADTLFSETTNKLNQLKQTKGFAKLSGLETFQSKNSSVVNKVLNNQDIFTEIK